MRRVRERGKIGKAASLSKKGQNRGRRRNNSNGCLLPGAISASSTHGSRTALKYDCWASAGAGCCPAFSRGMGQKWPAAGATAVWLSPAESARERDRHNLLRHADRPNPVTVSSYTPQLPASSSTSCQQNPPCRAI